MKLPTDETASVFDTLRATLQPQPAADMNDTGVDKTTHLLTSAIHAVSTTLLSTATTTATIVKKTMHTSSTAAAKVASSTSLIPSPLPSTSSSSLFFHKLVDSANVTATKVVSEVKDSVMEMFTNPAVTSPDDVGEGGGIINTPLTAPEASLATLADPLLGSSSDLKELGWIIPVVIVIIVAMVGLAFAFYFGVQKLEMRMLGWCYRNCGCCCQPGAGEGGRLLSGERYATLKEQGPSGADRKESVRMRDFRERPKSYGQSRNTSNEYTPRRAFNPFDDED